jgi:hypothetical protein
VGVQDVQVAGRGELVERRGVQVRRLFGDRARPAQLGRGAQPAEAQAGCHDLGEGAEQHRPVLGTGQCGEPGNGLAVVAQFAVRVVLDDPQARAGGHGGDRLAARRGHRAAGGVLEGGDEVEELGTLAADRLLQRRRIHPVGVPRHGDHACVREAEDLKCRQIAGVFDEDRVAGFEQGRGQQGQGLLGAGGDDQVVGGGGQAPGGDARGQGGPQHRLALGRGVLQRLRRAVRQDLLEGRRDAGAVEEFRGRQSAREVDHLGACGDREDVPHGRAAHRAGTRGERRDGGCGWGGVGDGHGAALLRLWEPSE